MLVNTAITHWRALLNGEPDHDAHRADWCRANPVNAYSAWPLQTGQDFLPNHLVDGIDFASIHMWPDNWGRTDQTFGRAWLDAHMKDAWYLGKPVVIEEFGKAVGARLCWGIGGFMT